MQTEDKAILMRWYQFIYFQKGISAKAFRKEKMEDILLNVSLYEAMMKKDKRLQEIEDMKNRMKNL